MNQVSHDVQGFFPLSAPTFAEAELVMKLYMWQRMVFLESVGTNWPRLLREGLSGGVCGKTPPRLFLCLHVGGLAFLGARERMSL